MRKIWMVMILPLIIFAESILVDIPCEQLQEYKVKCVSEADETTPIENVKYFYTGSIEWGDEYDTTGQPYIGEVKVTYLNDDLNSTVVISDTTGTFNIEIIPGEDFNISAYDGSDWLSYKTKLILRITSTGKESWLEFNTETRRWITHESRIRIDTNTSEIEDNNVSEIEDPNLVYEMPLPFIGGVTPPYKTTWVPDVKADWKIEMHITMHDSFSMQNYTPEEFGVKDSTSTNARLAIGIIGNDTEAGAWYRCGGQFYNRGSIFTPNTSHKLELFWYGSTGQNIFKVDDVTIETATNADLEAFDVPLAIGGRNYEGNPSDRLVKAYDVTLFKVTKIP